MDSAVKLVDQEKSEERKAFLKALESMVNEYIEEAEHQEGTDYWEDFGPAESLVEDFALYITESKEAPPTGARAEITEDLEVRWVL